MKVLVGAWQRSPTVRFGQFWSVSEISDSKIETFLERGGDPDQRVGTVLESRAPYKGNYR